MENSFLIQSVVSDPFERLLLRVSTCLLNEPKYYKSTEDVVSEIRSDLSIVESLEPSFIVKLACYSRNSLNLRQVSNFILAWAATKPSTHPTLQDYFTSAINLPSDLLDFVEKYQDEIGNPAKVKIPTFLQKLIKKKFVEFNVYQLGKYCSEGKRKRELAKNGTQKLTMKKLIRICHIKSPAILIASIIGKKYPNTAEEFVESGYGTVEQFDSTQSGKRLKIPVPYTWETTLGKFGNKAECWEDLIKSNKLPFMATLRNLRNLLITGVDLETHTKVMEKLRNPEVIQHSRLFPFRFLSAYESIKVDLDDLKNLKAGENIPTPEPPKIRRRIIRSRRRVRGGRIVSSSDDSDEESPTPSLPIKKRKVIIPKEVATPEVIQGYKSAIDEAIKLATSLNVDPIRGNTVIFCDCSGSMDNYVSSKKVPSFNTCKYIGFLFGLMLRSVSESCEVFLFSSPNDEDFRCWRKVELQGENIFEMMEQMDEMADTLGGGTEFPTDWFEESILNHKWIDNVIIFTDMMISEQWEEDLYYDSFQLINEYRERVNSNMRYITVDLAGSALELNGARYEKDFKNLMIGGYSDAILQMISTSGVRQSDLVREVKPLVKKFS